MKYLGNYRSDQIYYHYEHWWRFAGTLFISISLLVLDRGILMAASKVVTTTT